MRNSWMLSACAALCLLATASPAESAGWTWRDLNPLSMFSSGPRKPPVMSPSILSGRLMRPPAPLRKLGQGTKRFFSRTWNTVTFNAGGQNADSASGNSWQRGSKAARQREANKSKPSWLQSLFVADEPEPVRTPNEFLKLDRPSY